MTALRRAPREVYRVYGEDEFLARVAELRDIEPAAPASARRLLHRVAGTTMLLAAAGMVGGLVALTSLSSGSGTGTRRRVAGLLAANGSRSERPRRPARLAPAEVWRQAAGARGYYRRGAQARKGSRERAPQRAGRPTRRSLDRPEPPVVSVDRTVPVADEAQTRGAPIDAVTSTSAAVASPLRRSGQSEFGFER
jgi:hypothetical protein